MTALSVLIDEHREAITSDLLDRGLRLHTLGDDLQWVELKAVVARAVADPYSELFRALAPEDAGWGRTEMLLAQLVDTAHWLQWVKTENGRKNIHRPKPIQRPGIEKPERIGTHQMTFDEMNDWLGWS